MTKMNASLCNGYQDKTSPVEKPPMFAFCMKPRGLEVPNKGSKQRSQRKISVSAHSNSAFVDHDGFHTFGNVFFPLLNLYSIKLFLKSILLIFNFVFFREKI